MASFWRENQLVHALWKTKVQAMVQGCSFFHFLLFSTILFYLYCSNSMKMEEMIGIEDIVESTQAPSFLTNSRVDMVGFVNPHKVVVKSSAFSTFPNVGNGGESDGEE
jgi:hypothetical protein